MLIDGTTASVGPVTYTWSAAAKTWQGPTPADLPATVYAAELTLPSIQPFIEDGSDTPLAPRPEAPS